MNDVERRALALVNEVAPKPRGHLRAADMEELENALKTAIEAHEAFRQDVSEAVGRFENVMRRYLNPPALDDALHTFLSRFIIQPKTDPLQEILLEEYGHVSADADAFRAALKSRGLEIREVGE